MATAGALIELAGGDLDTAGAATVRAREAARPAPVVQRLSRSIGTGYRMAWVAETVAGVVGDNTRDIRGARIRLSGPDKLVIEEAAEPTQVCELLRSTTVTY